MINLFPFQNDAFLVTFKMLSHMKIIFIANTDYSIVSYWRNFFFLNVSFSTTSYLKVFLFKIYIN